MPRISITDVMNFKSSPEPFTMLTAYDYHTAKLADQARGQLPTRQPRLPGRGRGRAVRAPCSGRLPSLLALARHAR